METIKISRSDYKYKKWQYQYGLLDFLYKLNVITFTYDKGTGSPRFVGRRRM